MFLVAFLWAGLWWMWPENVPHRWQAPRQPFQIKLVSTAGALQSVGDPTAFAFDSSVSYKQGDGQSAELLRMPGMPEGRRMFLDMRAKDFERRAPGPASGDSVWRKDEQLYEAAWDEEAVFGRTEQENQLVFELSQNLLEAGYEPGEFTEDELKGLAAGWEVRVLLDIDKTGAPAHVLIEKGSGNEDIDALVYRKILLGKPGSRALRGGRLKISYGFE